MNLEKTLSFLPDKAARVELLKKKNVPESEWSLLLEKSAQLSEKNSDDLALENKVEVPVSVSRKSLSNDGDSGMSDGRTKRSPVKKDERLSSRSWDTSKITVPVFVVNMIRAYELKTLLSGSSHERFSASRLIVSSVKEYFKVHDKELYGQFKDVFDDYLNSKK